MFQDVEERHVVFVELSFLQLTCINIFLYIAVNQLLIIEMFPVVSSVISVALCSDSTSI